MTKLVGLWSIVAIAACAVGHKSAMTPQQTSTSPTEFPSNDRTEIEQLLAKIDSTRSMLGYSTPAPPPETPGSRPQPFSAGPTPSTTCTHGTSSTCTDVCGFSDDICGNAARICELAAKLKGDEWAAGKCDSANNSCDQAAKQCCACQ